MKHLLAAAATATLLMAGAASAHEHKDHDKDRTVVADYDFKGFDSIDIEGVFELDVRPGKTFSVRTEATEKQAKRLNVTKNGDTLKLDRDDDRTWSRKSNNDGAILAIITMPRLVNLDIAGVAMGDVSAFDGGRVEIDIAGVGELTLSGTCDRLDIDVAGVGEIDARDLICEDVSADLGGVGELSVHATESIDADAGGVGTIEVYGNPNDREVSDGFLAKVNIR